MARVESPLEGRGRGSGALSARWRGLLIALLALSPRAAESKPGSAPSVEARKLLCARVELVTSSTGAAGKPDATLDLSEESSEGGGAELFLHDEYAHLAGAQLGESSREQFDYWFYRGELVCARETTTSVHTVLEQREGQPEGVPPYLRTDFRVYANGRVVYRAVYRVPQHDDHEPARAEGDTPRRAKALLARMRPKLPADGRPGEVAKPR